MQKEANGRKLRSPKLSRIEKLTKGLLAGNNANSLFTVREVNGKGRGVFLKASVITRDSFVMEYEGDLISEEEALVREKFYAYNGEGCYVLHFTFKGSKMAVDATRQFDSLARLINHSRNPNIRFHSPFVVDFTTGLPRIAAYALRDILKGEEIVVDYGINDGNISWLRNRQAGFVSDVDSSFDDSTCSQDGYQMSLKISPVRQSFTADDTLIKVKKTEVFSSTPKSPVIKKKTIILTRECGFCFKNLIPGKFRKAYFAGYQSIGVPEEIIRLETLLERRRSKKSEKASTHKMNPTVESYSVRTPCTKQDSKKVLTNLKKALTYHSVNITVNSTAVVQSLGSLAHFENDKTYNISSHVVTDSHQVPLVEHHLDIVIE